MTQRRSLVWGLIAAAGVLLGANASIVVFGHEPETEPVSYQAEPARWWKGNTHTHSWWSDGDSPPETIAAWYREHGYNFLVLSDHNRMQEGEFWYPIDDERKQDTLARYREQFGRDWVIEREREGRTEIKLRTLDEFRTLLESQGEFIFVKGEEITDRLVDHPVHINAVNTERSILIRGGETVAEVLQNNLDAVLEHGRRTGRPVFSHVNHPNFFYAITAEDLAELQHADGEGFFEIYNGHSGVRNEGDAEHPSVERLWDIVLALRLGQRGLSVVYGVATDDAHIYTRWGLGQMNPGRGWIMVRATRLTPDTISAAVKRGDFYSSSGVELREVVREGRMLSLEIEPQPGVDYTIEFVGTDRDADLDGSGPPVVPAGTPGRVSRSYGPDVGRVFERVRGTKASYTLTGREIYVRARVISNRPHPNPYRAGDVEMAWTQPLVARER